ncbi:hypothetical protein Cni_G17174 [Canna indica]|uniref:Uncharacterized protein n=1 Tax=Canna indica TaxID=4628 RepID=A0AAQ3KIU5_9LILI|nr:hypothetical protein Cni_G17173 [Canna indica]WOL08421.1 hypothetical protein Cni_G17174 [Canna indica]
MSIKAIIKQDPTSYEKIVLHAAPGYEPLPKPCSLLDNDLNLQRGLLNETEFPATKMAKNNSFGTNDPDVSSGSSIEESGCVYDSHHSSISSNGEGNESAIDSNESDNASVSVLRDAQDGREKALINVSDTSVDHDLANNIPALLAFEEIASLDPGQRVKKVIQVRFHHHLLPFKLAVLCNGKKFSTKLWPDIGYFVRPLSMSMHEFVDKEQQLPGMFEYSKRCIFKDHMEKIDNQKDDNSFDSDKIILVSKILASEVLSNSNVSLVSADIPVPSFFYR